MELFRTPAEDSLVSSAAVSMWTWVAVLTAAVGLWRIRSVGTKFDASPFPIPLPPPPPPSPLPSGEPIAQLVEDSRRTKERFTMVYSLDSAEESCECGGFECDEIWEEEEKLAGDGEAEEEFVFPLERSEWMGMWVRRRSDLGWYRYQDMKAINGSIVRLWCDRGLRQRM